MWHSGNWALIHQAAISTVLCDTAARAKHIVAISKAPTATPEGEKKSPLTRIIMMEDIGEELLAEAKQAGVEICSYEEVGVPGLDAFK